MLPDFPALKLDLLKSQSYAVTHEHAREPLGRDRLSGGRDARVGHRGLGRDRTSDQRIMSPPL